MCLHENYSNFPLKRSGWVSSKGAYSLPVWVPPSVIGEIPRVWWETVAPAGRSEDKMLAWTGEVNVNNVRQAGPGGAFTERGNSLGNCFVKFASTDKQRLPPRDVRTEIMRICKNSLCWNLNLVDFVIWKLKKKKRALNMVSKRRFCMRREDGIGKSEVSLFSRQGAEKLSLLFASHLF